MAPPSSVKGAPYLPFAGGHFRLALGLMPLPPGRWIEPDDHLAADLAAKRVLLAEHHDAVFAALPEAQAAAAELLALLVDDLIENHSAHFRRDGSSLFNRAAGESWDVARPALHPLELCGRLVQEDFCLIGGTDGLTLVGAVLCAPSRWRLADKIGRSVAAIHAPVPGYVEALERGVDRFFVHAKVGKPVWRLNWTILDDPVPFQPDPHAPAPDITAENAGDKLWLRVERQTLRRLPATGSVVFTIRTYITPLRQALAASSDARDLAAMLRDAPQATLAYKHITPFRDAVLAWLGERAASRPLRA